MKFSLELIPEVGECKMVWLCLFIAMWNSLPCMTLMCPVGKAVIHWSVGDSCGCGVAALIFTVGGAVCFSELMVVGAAASGVG